MTSVGNTGTESGSRYDVGVLRKALDVIEEIARHGPLTARELSQRTGISSTAAYRILGTLARRGFVVQDVSTRRYSFGSALVALSRTILGSVDLLTIARPTMAALREEFGETVNLGVLTRDHQLVYVEMLESERGLRTTVQVGSYDHLHSTALGRAILADLSNDEAVAMLRRQTLVRATPRTPSTIKAVMVTVDQARTVGYAVDDEENEIGVRCVGAAIWDVQRRPIGAISISGPVARIPSQLVPVLGIRIQAAAAEISRALGFVPAERERHG